VSAKKSSRLSDTEAAPVSFVRWRVKVRPSLGFGKLEKVKSMLFALVASPEAKFLVDLTVVAAFGNDVLSIVFRKAYCRSVWLYVSGTLFTLNKATHW
jgi:hypothetical protein